VVTADILLADRCLKEGAAVVAPNGKPFTADSIGAAVATRAILADLRAGMGEGTGGPPPFSKSDRSRFLSALDEALVRLKRGDAAQAASRISSRSQISTSAPASSRIIASSWLGPGVKRSRSVPRGTVG
jgi:hypothetical protein